MKQFLLFSFVLSAHFLFGQGPYGNLGIKQRFDNVYTTMYGPIYNISVTTNNVNAQGSSTWDKSQLYTSISSEDALGSTRSGSLDALLVMYEATCDIKYLWEFMEQATIIVQNRADKVSPQQSGSPYWFREQVAWHGRLLMPFAKFVYLVKSEQLESTLIPKSHKDNFANYGTYGDFSNWLNTSNIETMDFLLGRLWRGNDECMCKPYDGNYGDGIPNISRVCGSGGMDNSTSKSIMELNFQAPFGCALVYMYLANTTRVDYGVKVVEMARAYLTSKNGILTYNGTHNAYSWYHDGWQWQRENIFQNWGFRNEYKEDIGHGGYDILFPILYNKFYNKFYGTITGGQYFEDYQMVRFKNNFSKIVFNNWNVAQSYINGTTFDCSVFDLCSGIYGSQNQASYQNNAKLWMDLYKFDNTAGSQGPKVYDILMNFYLNVESVCPMTNANYGGLNIKGLADMCAANYKSEGLSTGCYTKSAQAGMESESTFSALVSPNPTSEFITITTDANIRAIEIYDLNGELLLSSANAESISLGGLSDGVYMIKIYSETGIVNTQRLVVAK